MAENKTQITNVSPRDFIAGVTPERRRREAERLLTLMEEATGELGVMWGPNIVGFGTYRYTYASGRSGDWMKVGFSPRKAKLSLYGLKGSTGAEPLLEGLGKHTSGVDCVYANKLEDLNEDVLIELVTLAASRTDYVA